MWISKEKWDKFKSELASEQEKSIYWKTKYEEIQYSLQVFTFEKLRDKIKAKEKIIEEQKDKITALNSESNYYKKLYLDELQKRLELADEVKKMEN